MLIYDQKTERWVITDIQERNHDLDIHLAFPISDWKFLLNAKGKKEGCELFQGILYRLTNAVPYHGAVHTDEDESLLAIVDDECTGERSKMESWSLLIDFRVAHLENKQSSVIHRATSKETRLSLPFVCCFPSDFVSRRFASRRHVNFRRGNVRSLPRSRMTRTWTINFCADDK